MQKNSLEYFKPLLVLDNNKDGIVSCAFEKNSLTYFDLNSKSHSQKTLLLDISQGSITKIAMINHQLRFLIRNGKTISLGALTK